MPPSVEAMTAMRRRVAVDEQREVELARDVEALLDVEAPHLLPAGPVCVRDELHAEDLARRAPSRLGGAALGDLDAAALAATTGVDLRLDDDDRAAGLVDELLGRGLAPRSAVNAAGYRAASEDAGLP